MTESSGETGGAWASLEALDQFCRAIFLAAGADAQTADAATRGMMHATRHGVDSHGVRLLDHYVRGLVGGRLNGNPDMRIVSSFGAIASLDADNAQGALAAYKAMNHAIELAGQFGIGAVSIRNTSHFGPAGAFAMEAANQGYIGLAFCNSDRIVRLHNGAVPFHGTNPIACGVPVRGGMPWLFDMATSAIPLNRVQLFRSLGQELPQGVASDSEGHDTTDAHLATMLAPLGGEFGFKGAGLAGIAEIFSSVLSGMRLSFDVASMMGPDFSTPRQMGAFVMALKPSAFVEQEVFDAGMQRYRDGLRNSRPRDGAQVMAAGDREWQVAEIRQREGAPVDPATRQAFVVLAQRYGLVSPVDR